MGLKDYLAHFFRDSFDSGPYSFFEGQKLSGSYFRDSEDWATLRGEWHVLLNDPSALPQKLGRILYRGALARFKGPQKLDENVNAIIASFRTSFLLGNSNSLSVAPPLILFFVIL